MKFFKTATEVGVCYLAMGVGAGFVGGLFGSMGGALHGFSKGLDCALSNSNKHVPECPVFAFEATTTPGQIFEIQHFLASRTAFVITTTAWNAMYGAAFGAGVGSMPISYPFFYAYDQLYGDIVSKNTTVPSLDNSCENPEEINSPRSFTL